MTETAAIETDQLLAHPPARVWQALTDPALLARWLMPSDFQAVVGHAFTFDTGGWGTAHCEVLELEPERLVRLSWVNEPLDTTVTWRLEPEGAGTRLFVVHDGFDLSAAGVRAAYEGMGEGWRTGLASALSELLDGIAADGSTGP